MLGRVRPPNLVIHGLRLKLKVRGKKRSPLSQRVRPPLCLGLAELSWVPFYFGTYRELCYDPHVSVTGSVSLEFRVGLSWRLPGLGVSVRLGWVPYVEQWGDY